MLEYFFLFVNFLLICRRTNLTLLRLLGRLRIGDILVFLPLCILIMSLSPRDCFYTHMAHLRDYMHEHVHRPNILKVK